jgi:hypothetical protein
MIAIGLKSGLKVASYSGWVFLFAGCPVWFYFTNLDSTDEVACHQGWMLPNYINFWFLNFSTGLLMIYVFFAGISVIVNLPTYYRRWRNPPQRLPPATLAQAEREALT